MKRIIAFFFPLFWVFTVSAQQQGIEALKADYPKLMEKFGIELEEQRADYIFALDVSGTMGKYEDMVAPALREFFHSLQEGDYVSVIKFGSEATSDVGGAGMVDAQTIKNLVSATNQIYKKPTELSEKEKYYYWTDLDNMLHYIAKDMQQIGRNRIKFVFIVTDFEHDPSPARRGKEDWDGVARRFATEQAGNYVYVFALQLPGGGRDLERVQKVFPDSFGFKHVPIISGDALYSWFTQRKNEILLDRFKALIYDKIKPAELSVCPNLSLEGDLSLEVSWTSNEVYDCLRLDSLAVDCAGFHFSSLLPYSTDLQLSTFNAGKVMTNNASVFNPQVKRFSGSVRTYASYDVQYQDELNKLGVETPSIISEAQVSRMLFCYPLPLWVFCCIIGLILLYVILVLGAIIRNASSNYKIQGHFEVTKDGLCVSERLYAVSRDAVDFGRDAAFIPVPGCNWRIHIKVKKYNPFLFFFKSPKYIAHMSVGHHFNAMGRQWGLHQFPSIPRFTHINIDQYQIRWIR